MTLQEYIQDAHDKIDRLGIFTKDYCNLYSILTRVSVARFKNYNE
jgi:hypothetical protein